MSPLGRLVGRVREQLAELGESIAGNAAQRALDHDIRETDARLHEWRASLAGLQASRFTAQERTDAAIAGILQREAQALAALQAGKPALAREVALAIAQLEQARDDEQAYIGHLEGRIQQMRQLIEQGETALRRLRHRLDVLRATETVQRAQEAVAGRQAGGEGHPPTALEALRRVRGRAAAAPGPDLPPLPLEDPELDAKLREAGILERDARAELVLARLAERLEPERRPTRRSRAPLPSRDTP